MAQISDVHENLYTELIDRITQKVDSLSERLGFIMKEKRDNAEGRCGESRLESLLITVDDKLDEIHSRLGDTNTPTPFGKER